MDGDVTGRANQRRRTRKDLIAAASRLAKQGGRPTLDEIATAALVSRATAYRYFPNVETLLVEAALDIAVPSPETLFDAGAGTGILADPVARVQRVDAALHDMILANESALRTMLVHSLAQALAAGPDGKLPVRQNRRTPLIEAALEPARHRFRPGTLDTLCKALALIIGTEGMIAAKDVLQLDDADARRVKRWAVRALVEAALKPPSARKAD